MADLKSIAWDSKARLTEAADAEQRVEECAALTSFLVATAASQATSDVSGKLIATLGSCLSPALPEGTVLRVENEAIQCGDVVMAVFADATPAVCKVYLGRCTPETPLPEFDDYSGSFLVFWAANPEMAAFVPETEIAGLWPVRGIWNAALGWRDFARYPFTADQLHRIGTLDAFGVHPDILIPHRGVLIDSGVPRD